VLIPCYCPASRLRSSILVLYPLHPVSKFDKKIGPILIPTFTLFSSILQISGLCIPICTSIRLPIFGIHSGSFRYSPWVCDSLCIMTVRFQCRQPLWGLSAGSINIEHFIEYWTPERGREEPFRQMPLGVLWPLVGRLNSTLPP